MFTWNIEEMKLRNEVAQINYTRTRNRKYIFKCENEISREDKINFVDSLTDGKLSYILNLVNKFKIDSPNIKVDDYGYPKTVSLKAWIKRNDTKYTYKMIDDWYHYGRISFLNCERWIYDSFETRCSAWDTHCDYVDEIFHRQLYKCLDDENRYFKEQDEYEILKYKFRNKNYNTTFGINISVWSSGKICVVDGDNERDITIDELKWLLAQYDKLDKLVESITSEACNHITF